MLAEFALRFTDYYYISNPYISMPDNYFITDPDLGTDMAPNFPPARVSFQGPEFVTFTNRYGCFDYDRPVEND